MRDRIKVTRIYSSFTWCISGINKLLEQLSRSKKKRCLMPDDLVEITKNPNTYFIILEDNDMDDWTKRIAAMGLISFQPKPSGWKAEIDDIVRDKNSDVKGLGTRIMNKLLSIAQEFANEKGKVIPVSLTCGPDRVIANKLYRKLGFKLRAQAVNQHGTNLYRLKIKPQ